MGVVIEILVMLILYHETVPVGDYVKFFFGQATIFQFWTPDSLRGYGCGTPNGALWTICVIIQFYFIAWFIYKLLHKKKLITWIIVFVASVAISLISYKLEGHMPTILYKLLHQTIVPYMWLFIAGSIAAEYWGRISFGIQKYFWAFLVIAGLLVYIPIPELQLGNYKLISVILFFTGWIGFAYRFPALKLPKDISYALYIYHMIAVNAFIVLGYTGTMLYALVAILVCLLLATCSTVFVGEKAGKMMRMA